MKKSILIALLFMISTSLFSQSVLPSALKDNWLNANDSIEWIISFMPEFAVYDMQFWDYEAIEPTNDGYKIVLSNETSKHQINAGLTNNGSLRLIVDKQKPLHCTRKKTSHPDFSNHNAPAFSGSLLKDDTVTIRGFIEDYDPELYVGTGYAYYLNTLTRFTKTYNHPFEIAPDGRFEVKFRAFNPQLIYFSIEGSTHTHIFIFPGEAQMIGFNNKLTEVTKDKRKWEGLSDFEINHYMGHSGMLSEETLYLESFYRNNLISGFTKATNMELMPQLTYIRWRKQVYTDEVKSMDSIMTALNSSERARQVITSELETDLLADLYTYHMDLIELKQYSQSYIEEMPLMDYYSQKYLFSGKHSTINIYIVEYNRHQDVSTYKSLAANFMLNYILNIAQYDDTSKINDFRNKLPYLGRLSTNISFSEESFQYDSTLNKNSAIFWKPYNDLYHKYFDVIPDSVKLQAQINELNHALNKFGDGITGQMYAMFWLMLTQKNTSLDEQLIQWAQQHITEPVLLNFLLEDHTKKKEAESRYITYAKGTIFIDSLPSIAGSDAFFDEIITRFKGKVIYIDFWADWCSPCRAEIKPAAKLKKEYEGKDIVFLYFGKSCKKSAWQQLIMQEQMEGYHYWLDKNQSNVLSGRFEITGIPHYLLVDKSGEILKGEAPMPSDRAEIRKKLDELLRP